MMLNLAQNLIDALSLGSIYALTALGIGMIFSVMRLVNFAQGNYIAFCAFALLVPAGEGISRPFIGLLPGWVLVPVVLAIGVLLAMASEILLFRHLRGAQPATMMIASFGLGSALQNLLLMMFGSRPIAINLWPSLTQPIMIGGLMVPRLQLVILAVTALALLALTLFLQRTRFGTAMRASSENFLMARMLGVPADRVILAAFGISGALAATASLLTLPQTGIADIRMGDGILLVAFVATVVGGLGSLTGAVVSAYLIGLVSVFLQIALPLAARPYRDAFVYAAVIAVLMLKPDGLFSAGSRSQRI
ncbi:branched-chain amino acid ABC transporter permease [Mesorhizobium sp.]|uniref:branched-chain amino acid ABC transporter permease n=2 Tax=unclassified Mesorhizobium TaxID=325217 RepID=UPI0025C26553|nr:branched-chain amino acid ABC transporter permease [Mesorhizobium sp.]